MIYIKRVDSAIEHDSVQHEKEQPKETKYNSIAHRVWWLSHADPHANRNDSIAHRNYHKNGTEEMQ